MAFTETFLADRGRHLAAKLIATRQALQRDGMLPAAKKYKTTVHIPEIIAAHERIAEGTYGYCFDCSNEIPEARLLKHPHVERCVPCQAEVEKRNKKF